MRKVRVKSKKKKRKRKTKRKKKKKYSSKWSEKGQMPKAVLRVRRAVDVVPAWKALPPGEGRRTSPLKMADEVLKHLKITVILLRRAPPKPVPTSPNV
ncbi:hypothetical protein Scep_019625 [Stephania cephalantha]|uniref:Uncharacterized protein n=1 Tax=Stephania cephalantha TaxID=152367 RepID=A0AAP0NQ01_9MAGN